MEWTTREIAVMKDLIQCKHLAKEYTESPMGEEHRLKLPCYRQFSVCLAMTALLEESSYSSFAFWFGFLGFFCVWVLEVFVWFCLGWFFLICAVYGSTFSRLN